MDVTSDIIEQFQGWEWWSEACSEEAERVEVKNVTVTNVNYMRKWLVKKSHGK